MKLSDQEFNEVQEQEAYTWNLEDKDPDARAEKSMREAARYPLLAKQMGLTKCIDTSKMLVYDIGCGPINGGVSSVIQCAERVCIDPNKEAYSKYYNTHRYLGKKAEELKSMLMIPDLIITTNCIDHFQDPMQFLEDLNTHMKYGAYWAHHHAIDNAINHPHPAHKFNLNEEIVNKMMSKNFELVWYMNYKEDGLVYSWLHEPSFCQLWRRVNHPAI